MLFWKHGGLDRPLLIKRRHGKRTVRSSYPVWDFISPMTTTYWTEQNRTLILHCTLRRFVCIKTRMIITFNIYSNSRRKRFINFILHSRSIIIFINASSVSVAGELFTYKSCVYFFLLSALIDFSRHYVPMQYI